MADVRKCAVPADALEVVADADYADAYEMEFFGHRKALDLARGILLRASPGVKALMALRNAAVRPFGLKTAAPSGGGARNVGFFPLLTVTDRRAVLGMNDQHLDFRLVADARPLQNGNTRFILSTVIKRHSVWGRFYLAAVLPFHRVIVPAFLRRGQR